MQLCSSYPDEQLSETETIARYTSLVKHVAGRIAVFLPPHIELDDLLGDGIIGLLEAARKFQPGRGVKFKTYAALRIRGAILDGLRRLDWAPRRLRRQARDVEQHINELAHALGRTPTRQEVAERMGIPMPELDDLLGDIEGSHMVSLDELRRISDSTEFLLGESVADHSEDVLCEVERRQRQEVLARAIDGLGTKDRTVVSLFYYEGLTNSEVAEVMGVSPARVCFLHARALRRLKDALAEWRSQQLAER